MEFKSKIKTIEWVDTYSKMVDQTVVPYEYKFVNITGGQEMFEHGVPETAGTAGDQQGLALEYRICHVGLPRVTRTSAKRQKSPL